MNKKFEYCTGVVQLIMYCLHWHVTFLAFLSVIEFLLFDIIKMKMASYLIRLGSKGLGKDVTMPLVKAEKE